MRSIARFIGNLLLSFIFFFGYAAFLVIIYTCTLIYPEHRRDKNANQRQEIPARRAVGFSKRSPRLTLPFLFSRWRSR